MIKLCNWGHKVGEQCTVAMAKYKALRTATPQTYCETGHVTLLPSASVSPGFSKVVPGTR